MRSLPQEKDASSIRRVQGSPRRHRETLGINLLKNDAIYLMCQLRGELESLGLDSFSFYQSGYLPG